MATLSWDEIMQPQSGADVPVSSAAGLTWDQIMEQDSAPEATQEGETSFAKGFVEGESLTQQAGDILTAATGLGGQLTYRDKDGYGLGYQTTAEKYGDDFDSLSFDDRRKRIVDQRTAQIEKEYGDVEGSTAGNIIGMLADPTSLLPVGATYKGMAAIGGAVGGSYSAADQLLHKGEVDISETGANVILGAIAAPALGYAFIKVGQGIKNISTKAAVKSANKALDDVDALISHNISQGVSPTDAGLSAIQRLGLSEADVIAATMLTNRKPRIPNIKNAVAIVEKEADVGLATRLIEGLSSRIKEHSPKVWQELRKYEANLAAQMQQRKDTVAPFMKALSSYSSKTQTKINTRLVNGDYKGAKKLMTKGGTKELDDVSKMVTADGKHLETLVDGFKALKGYFPRKVKNLEGLRKAIGNASPKAANELKIGLEAALKKEGVNSIGELSENAMTTLVTKATNKAYPRVLGGAKAHRSVQEIPPELMKFYENANTSLLSYVESTTRSFEKSKLLGTSNLRAGKIDLKSPLYRTLGRELQRGRLSSAAETDLKSMLQTRFTVGEQSMHKGLSAIKDIGYMSTLGQFRSAATQLKDIGTAAYLHGTLDTIKAVLNFKSTRVHDAGLIDTVSAEMSDVGNLRKWLNRTLKLSGFRAVDRFGKKVLMEASSTRGAKLASTPKGQKLLLKKYGEAYGDDFPQLLNSLKNGTDDWTTDLYRWHEISDTQPVSLLELPSAYLNNPDMRIAYALKSFGLKQLTLLHNNIVKRAKKGDKLGATREALKYAAFIGVAGGTVDEAKDWMAGEGFEMSDIPDNILENLTSLFFINSYSIGDIEKGDFAAVAGGLITPPTSVLTGGIKDINREMQGIPIGESEAPINLIKTMPVVGRVIYDWVLGGREKAIERADKERLHE